MDLSINNYTSTTPNFSARLNNPIKKAIKKGILTQIKEETSLSNVQWDLDTYLNRFEEIKKQLAATGKKGTFFITNKKELSFEGPGIHNIYEIPPHIKSRHIKMSNNGKVEEISPAGLEWLGYFFSGCKILK